MKPSDYLDINACYHDKNCVQLIKGETLESATKRFERAYRKRLRGYEILSDRKHVKNCVRIRSHNSIKHECAKFRKAFDLVNEGHEIITEAVFKDGKGIADLVDTTAEWAYEFANTETLDSLVKKAGKYPIKFAVEYVK